MKIALGQIRLIGNNPKHNYEKIKAFVLDAKAQDVDLIVFPELSLPGVYVDKRNLHDDYINEILNYNQKVIALADGIEIIFGTYLKDDYLYNVAIHAKDKMHQNTAYKSKLNPLLNEELFFKAKKETFKIFIGDRDYEVSLDNSGEEILHIGNHFFNHEEKLEYFKHSISVSAVGLVNTGNHVYGLNGDTYFNYHGFVAACNNVFEEELLVQDTDYIIEYINLESDEILPYILPMIEMFDEEFIPWKPKWLVGVSGGLDSSVTVSLLTLALGEDRVIGVTMPGTYTGDITLSNAYQSAKKLGIKFKEVPINKMVDATIASLDYETVEGLAYENIQARLRGHTLMSISSMENGIISNNGNKIEAALGYATLYGDAIGGLAILGDLNKLEVGQVANEINEAYEDEVIPHNIIPLVENGIVSWEFAPSAELAADQFDPFKWGYHDYLVPYLFNHSPSTVLEMYLDKSIYDTKFGKFMDQYGLDDPKVFVEDLEWIVRLIQNASFKRLQSPPILRLTNNSFIFETQTTVYQTEHYQNLKNRILNEKKVD